MKAQTFALLVLSFLFSLSLDAGATNTAANVVNTKTDLTSAASFSTNPTYPGATNDVTFTNVTYSPLAFTLNSSENWGTLDDLSTTSALTIDNTTSGPATTDTLTLSQGSNHTSGATSTDYIYVASSANLSIGTGSGGNLTVDLGTPGSPGPAGNAPTGGIHNNGTLDIASALIFYGSAATQSLNFTGSGNTTVSGAISTSDSNTLTINNSGTVTFSGGVSAKTLLTAGTLDLTSESTASFVINGGTFSESSAGSLHGGSSVNLTVGGGVATLSGINTYSGATTVSGGTLEFGIEKALYDDAPASWTATNIVVQSGATAAFAVGGSNQFTSGDLNTLLALGTGSGGFENGSIIGLDTTGGNFSYSSTITNTNSGSNVVSLTKLGTNALTLSGTNTYSGVTTISAGTVEFSIEKALYNNNTAGSGWTASDLVVQSGATAAFAVGTASPQFTSSDLNTLLALGTASGGFENGSIIGLDTTAGNFTYSNNITNTNSGSNVVSLTKLGTSTLTLSGANTYTGATTINGGTLNAAGSGNATGGTGSLNNTSGVTINNGGTLLFGATDAIYHSATLNTLTGGTGTATISMQGLSNATETMGALTLNTGTTIINFGSGTGSHGNTLEFSSLTFNSNSAVVDVYNWNGPPYTSGIDSGSIGDAYDRLLFASLTSAAQGDLTQINFYSGNGTGFIGTGGEIAFTAGAGSFPDEVVPEPPTVFAATCLLGLIGWRGRRRLQELVCVSIVTFRTS